MDAETTKKLIQNNLRKQVKEILADETKNISWLPDSVEEKIYLNVLTILSNSIISTLEATKMEILGQEITFKVGPKKPE